MSSISLSSNRSYVRANQNECIIQLLYYLAWHNQASVFFFCPSSPTKSGRKPQKRYLTSDEDDDDSLHFQPSPSVRRKLSHSFANENFSRYRKLWYS